MSIESQASELRRRFADDPTIEIVCWYEESKSAKSPGRPIFDKMIRRIEEGEARGIITWAPDRLARNSIDGGHIVYQLDRGVIADLKFATYTFENNSQGKFMLQIMFGQSKYYSDALSENVKRGNRTKIENGWRPNLAPLGYLNDPRTKTIVKDPIYFPLVRKMFDLMLTGAYSTRQIARVAHYDWGFTTPVRRRIGGVPLPLSSVHYLLTNPFYAGQIKWDGRLYPGKHEPMVTMQEFRAVADMIRKPDTKQPSKYSFAFTGLIRCGSCGMRITAEHKTNRFGSRYLYYHCTRRNPGHPCKEPSVEIKDLETQILAFLKSVGIHPRLHGWMNSQFQPSASDEEVERAISQSLRVAKTSIASQLTELTGLRLRQLINDEEYLSRRSDLEAERLRVDRRLEERRGSQEMFEPLRRLISFSIRATELFTVGNDTTKRLILSTVGSNLSLSNKKLFIEAAKPFAVLQRNASQPNLLGSSDTVRTFSHAEGQAIAQEFRCAWEEEPRRDDIIKNLRTLTL